MKSANTVIVTGAAGWIGGRVCRALKTKGARVVACDLAEKPGDWDAFFPLDITGITPERTGELRRLCTEGPPEALIHCAGLAHRPVETADIRDRMFQVNEEGTRQVLRLCRELDIPRVVYVSSIAFYDWSLAGVKPEASPVQGLTAYAASKLAGENLVRESGLDWRVARLATVFGEGDPANFAKLAKALKAKKFILPGRGTARKSVISVDVAADCLSQWALLTDTPHRLINLGFTAAPTLREICDAFAIVCGFARPKALPLPLFRLMALAGNAVARLKPEFPLTTATLQKLSTSTHVDCSQAAEIFPLLTQTTFQKELEKAHGYYQAF